MGEVLSLTVPFFGLIFLGFFVGRLVRKPASGLEWLNIFILYVALPALFFQLLAETPFNELSNIDFIFAVVAATYGVFCTAFIFGLLRNRWDIETATIQGLVGAYANNGYLGPGLAITALGAPAAVPVALIFAFENTMFFIVTPILMAIGGEGLGGPAALAARILKKIFTHPFIIATIAGTLAAAAEWQPPDVIDRLLTMLRNAAAPCALFAMGVTVALQKPPTRESVGDLSLFLSIKLLLHPLAAFAMLSLVPGLDPLWLVTAIMMAALPPATNVFVLATQYGRFVEGASNAVLVGTGLSAVSVTVLLYIIKSSGFG